MANLKIGIFGVGRGVDLARDFLNNGCDIVALCDTRREKMEEAAQRLGGDVAIYENFDEFIEHGLDAVVLANYFHEHAPYAIKCFERNIHVYSECISNGTMAEGVELIRAFEKSSSIYMLAENYPQMRTNREIKRVCDGGSLGKILFAEGEYNHPVSPTDAGFSKRYNYFEGHWRNYLPRTYYITHSLGPVMWATGATPKRVSAFVATAPLAEDRPTASRVGGDNSAIILTQNDDGSVFRVCGCAAFGAHNNSYRVCGTEGQIESLRGMSNKIMLRYNSWSKPEGMEDNNLYEPSWNDPDEEFILKSGHGGGDYLTFRMFVDCIREGRQPEHPFDIHSAVTMSSVAILAHRSALAGGASFEIPDFHDEACRVQYENDNLTPFPGEDGSEPTICPSTCPDHTPSELQLKLYHELLNS